MNTGEVAVVPVSLSETVPNVRSVTEPRHAFSLSYGEVALALAVLAGAWFAPYSLVDGVPNWSVYWQDLVSPGLAEMKFGYSVVNAFSAVCVYRFLWRRKTRSVSRLGYAALSLPAAQTVLMALTSGFDKPGAQPPPAAFGFALATLAVCSIALHLVLSLFVSARSLRRAETRGDMVALPLFCGWAVIWFWLAIWIARNST